jgi:hypothetical protein
MPQRFADGQIVRLPDGSVGRIRSGLSNVAAGFTEGDGDATVVVEVEQHGKMVDRLVTEDVLEEML